MIDGIGDAVHHGVADVVAVRCAHALVAVPRFFPRFGTIAFKGGRFAAKLTTSRTCAAGADHRATAIDKVENLTGHRRFRP
jgi:hypothetical protein